MILLLTGRTDNFSNCELLSDIKEYIGQSRKSLEYLDKIIQKKHEASKSESLLGMYLLVRALKNMHIYGAEFSRSRLGAPIITHNEKTVPCSVSHKSGFAAVCVSDDGEPVGVDIELPADTEKSADIVRRFFSDSEREQFEKATDKSAKFAEMWTKKEALSKLFGTGFDRSPKEFDISDEYAKSLNSAYTTLNIDGYIITVLTKERTKICHQH